VRTVVKHVTKRLRRHWPKTRIVWRGDSHYGRIEATEWAENYDPTTFFGSPAFRARRPYGRGCHLSALRSRALSRNTKLPALRMAVHSCPYRLRTSRQLSPTRRL
jgi:hypothetical protein